MLSIVLEAISFVARKNLKMQQLFGSVFSLFLSNSMLMLNLGVGLHFTPVML